MAEILKDAATAEPDVRAEEAVQKETAQSEEYVLADGFAPESGMWVALRDLPSEYSYEEALLLCECREDVWVSWVPGHGETLLSRGQFHQSTFL